MSQPTLSPIDVSRLLERRTGKQSPTRFQKLADSLVALAPSTPPAAVVTNDDEMWADFVISTRDVDRSGDLVETDGVRTEEHRRNPVVLWDHGNGTIGKVPIGACQDPQGNYTVVVHADEGVIIARVYFSRTLKFARELFLIVKEGILRGASIAFRPIRARIMPGYSPDDDDTPLHLEEVELCELSLVAVPDNQNSLLIRVGKALGEARPSNELLRALGVIEKGDVSGEARGSDGKWTSGSGGGHGEAKRPNNPRRAQEHDREQARGKESGGAHPGGENETHHASGKPRFPFSVQAGGKTYHRDAEPKKADAKTGKPTATYEELHDGGAGGLQSGAKVTVHHDGRIVDAKGGAVGRVPGSGTETHHEGGAPRYPAAVTAGGKDYKPTGSDNGDAYPPGHPKHSKLYAAGDGDLVVVRHNGDVVNDDVNDRKVVGRVPGSSPLPAANHPTEKTVKTQTNKGGAALTPKFAADLMSLDATGRARLSKALAQITGKAATDYLPMGDDGRVKADDGAMNTTSLADGGAATDDVTTSGGTDLEGKGDDGATPAGDTDGDGDGDPDAAMKPGAEAISSVYDYLMMVGQEIERRMGMQENPAVKEKLESLAELIETQAKELADTHAAEYPEADKLSADAGSEDQADDAVGPTEDDAPATDADKVTAADDADADADAGEKADADGDDDDAAKKDVIEKRLRAVRRKAMTPARRRLDTRVQARQKSIAAIREKKVAVKTKRMGKRIAGVIQKAAGFLDQASGHDGEWSDMHKAASSFHCKALTDLAAQPVAMAGDDGQQVGEMQKTIRDLTNSRDDWKKAAQRAAGTAETFQKEIRRLRTSTK